MKHLVLNALRVTFFFLLLNACNSNADPSNQDCPLGEPTPIFSSDYEFVKSHQFSKNKQLSTEEIYFSDHLQLTIRQSGCEQVRQVYEFVVPGSTSSKPDSFWIEQSAVLFSKLAAYEEKFYSFNQWANKINQHKSDIKLIEAFELAPGMYIQVDRIRDANTTLLQVNLFGK